MRTLLASLVLVVPLTSGCLSLDYDLSRVPIPISAKPAEPGASRVEPFRIEARHVLWVHGLFGRSRPDVAALVTERAAGWDRIADFRVRQESNVHHWLTAHLSATLVRMRKVVVEGQLVRDEPADRAP